MGKEKAALPSLAVMATYATVRPLPSLILLGENNRRNVAGSTFLTTSSPLVLVPTLMPKVRYNKTDEGVPLSDTSFVHPAIDSPCSNQTPGCSWGCMGRLRDVKGGAEDYEATEH